MKRSLLAAAVVAAAFTAGAGSASAALPDGPGPWADTVESATQGQRADGTPVTPERSDPTAALGVAERTDAVGTFFSLGFGGQITLGFANTICNAPGPDFALEIVEVTFEPYPSELVDVYVSQNGTDFVLVAEDVDKDAMIDLPDSINMARFVRLVDVSHVDDFAGLTPPADAFDVDGVRALNTNCTGVGRMTGGGKHQNNAQQITHGFTLRCTGTPNNLTVTWKNPGSKKANTFKLGTLTSRICYDDATLNPAPPQAPFDSFHGRGTGKVNNASGYTIDFLFQDGGEPSVADTSRILITKTSDGSVVLNMPTTTIGGNHQAH